MSTSKPLRAGAALGSLLAVTSGSRMAHALSCTDPSLPSPIYAVGAAEPVPLLGKVATALANLSSPITFIYQSSGGACSGVETMITPPATGLTGNATYWSTTGVEETCTFMPPGPTADLGISESYATLCPGVTSLPAGVGDFLGPVQVFDFIVPAASQAYASISAQAGYFVFGFGAGSSVPSYPVGQWTVPQYIITRNDVSSTAMITAATLGVPLADVANTTLFTDGESSAGVLDDVASSSDASATLGILASNVAEGATAGTIKVLPYQHYGQSCGWLPNSTPTMLDKVNVRYGLYAYWSNIHFFANVDTNNVPTDVGAKQVIGWFQDTVAPPTGVNVDQLTVQAGEVLQCAMEVQRTVDAGPLLPYAPAEPCGCFFEATATGSTTCQACTSNAACPANAPNCRKGYCEVN